jgi:hypothetical protein
MIEIIVALILVGVALYIISLIPMDNTIKQIIRVLIIVFVCLWVLDYFGWYEMSFLHFHHR